MDGRVEMGGFILSLRRNFLIGMSSDGGGTLRTGLLAAKYKSSTPKLRSGESAANHHGLDHLGLFERIMKPVDISLYRRLISSAA